MRYVQRALRTLPSYALLTLCAAALLFPLYVTIVNSLHPIAEFLTNPPPSLWPSHPQWKNYVSGGGAVADTPLPRYLLNSFVTASAITAGQLITSALAAYAFAFLRFPGRGLLFAAFLATGFGTFLLRQAFLTIPRELKDAAEMDGYGHLRFLVFVAAPLARGALATLAVFAFLQAWNQYLWPLLVTNDPDMRTVQIGIAAETKNLDKINVAFAGTVVAFLPMLLLVVAFQRSLVRGLFGGAVKG